MNKNLEKIIDFIQTKIDNTNKKNIIIGISGGIDSCLTLAILKLYIKNINIYPYYLPIEFNHDFDDINLIANFLNIKIPTVDLTHLWYSTINEFNIKNTNNQNNLKSKIRNMFLYAQAFELDGLVISNLNYDEYYLGYFTKFGDSNGDLYPLINLLKKEIIELSQYLNLPKQIINKQPSAGLYINQTDEQELGLSYQVIDDYLMYKNIPDSDLKKINQIINKNKHKRILNYLIDNAYRKD